MGPAHLARPLRAFLAMALAIAMLAAHGRAAAQAVDGDVTSLRDATRAALVGGCVVSLTDPTVQKMRASHAELTEQQAREMLAAPPMSLLMENICRCVTAKWLAQVDEARTTEQMAAISRDMLATVEANVDGDAMAARCKPDYSIRTPRDSPAAPTWEKAGHWPDADACVDGTSLKWTARGKGRAWVRTVLQMPQTIGEHSNLLSLQTLESFDGASHRFHTLSVVGFTDRGGLDQALRVDTPDMLAELQPDQPGVRTEALVRSLCDREGAR